MSTENIGDGNDHSRVVALHDWSNSAANDVSISKKWWFHSLYLANVSEIPGGTAGMSKFVKRLKRKVPRPACCEGAQKINVDEQHGNNVLSLRRGCFGWRIVKADRMTFNEPSLDVVAKNQSEQNFSIGNEVHAHSDQLEIVLHVTGEKGWSSLGEAGALADGVDGGRRGWRQTLPHQ